MDTVKIMILIMLLSCALAALLGPLVIRLLQKEHASQTEREAGPSTHKKKSGTPTMGGFIFLIPFTIFGVAAGFYEKKAWAVLTITLLFALIGFADDFIKVVLKRNLGLTPRQKIIMQTAATLIFGFLLEGAFGGEREFNLIIPFAGGLMSDFGLLKYPLLLIITLATTNGTNFTDGVDGLLASVTAAVCGFFIFVFLLVRGMDEGALVYLPASLFGALLGYLFYNVYPGRVMMGDTGSLAIGGFVVGMSYAMHIPLFIPIFGIIYAVEVISVVLQVTYFKATHGKRLFRMAPIHHHFELMGWSETRVVNVFTTVTVAGGAVAAFILL